MRASAMGTKRAVALVAVALLLSPVPAEAQEAEAPPPVEDPAAEEPAGPTPEELQLAAATRAVSSALAKLAAASRRAASTDYALRLADRALVGPLVRLGRAVEREARTIEAAAETAGLSVAADAEVERARGILQHRAGEVYKYGSVQRSAATLSAVRSATGPLELARSLRDLESVFGHAHHELENATHVAAAAAQAVLDAQLEVRLAQRELAASQRAVEEAEARVAARRRRAQAAEASWLGAARLVHQAEAWLAEASGAAQRAAAAAAADAGAPPAPAPAPAATEPPGHDHGDLEEGELPGVGSLTQVANRQRALDRARRLSDADRRSRYDLVCPVEGATFEDDWHYPRSHLRRHEGTDLFAPRGTAVVTVEDATIVAIDAVDQGADDLGGISVSYVGADGSRWYAAHLGSLAAGLEVGQSLPAGSVIGTVGTTGNARGTPPHLHLGWYRDRIALNPYASLAAACAG